MTSFVKLTQLPFLVFLNVARLYLTRGKGLNLDEGTQTVMSVEELTNTRAEDQENDPGRSKGQRYVESIEEALAGDSDHTFMVAPRSWPSFVAAMKKVDVEKFGENPEKRIRITIVTDRGRPKTNPEVLEAMQTLLPSELQRVKINEEQVPVRGRKFLIRGLIAQIKGRVTLVGEPGIWDLSGVANLASSIVQILEVKYIDLSSGLGQLVRKFENFDTITESDLKNLSSHPDIGNVDKMLGTFEVLNVQW